MLRVRLLAIVMLCAAARLDCQVVAPPTGQIVGIVREAGGLPIHNASVTMIEARGTWRTETDGKFRTLGLGPGAYTINVRAIGFQSAMRTIVVDTGTASIIIELDRISTTLSAIVAQAKRGGLAGIIRDSSGAPLPGVQVAANGAGVSPTKTDSSGQFFMPVKTGRYFVRIEKAGYQRQMLSVTVPANEGRQIFASLSSQSGDKSAVEGANLFDLQQRMIRSNPVWARYVSREDITNFGVKNALQIAQRFAASPLEQDECALIDGGPRQAPLWSIGADEIEFMETTAAAPRRRTGASPITSARRGCRHIVWMRK